LALIYLSRYCHDDGRCAVLIHSDILFYRLLVWAAATILQELTHMRTKRLS